jgi:signal transduction histidine kinase
VLRADEAEKSNRLQEKFLAMLTHELKTPLAVIRLAVAKHLVPSPRLKEQAVLAIDDISMIIDRCSNSEKITAGKIQTYTKAVCLPDLISLIIAEQSQAHRISFLKKQQDACQLTTIQSDPDYLRIILSNLLDNALKYSPERSTVNIVLDIIGATIEIRIDNVPNDAGFPDATQVFEKYYRSAGAHQRIGAGLGLYIVRELAHQLGMNIRYDIKEERVVFTLTIPVIMLEVTT